MKSQFVYLSLCCSAEATKPPCVKVFTTKKKKGKKGEDREKAQEFASLGHWTCGNCGKGCKVSVSLRPPKQETANG